MRRRVEAIVDRVKRDGDVALRALRAEHDGVAEQDPVLLDPSGALDEIAEDQQALLERTAERIRSFALAQRSCLTNLDTEVTGGRAGHTFAPVDRAGCYAPGGRYPLVSSVLMTVVTARAAGVEDVCVASPSSLPIMRAAAAIAGATSFLACGGAHAIAALAYGTETVPAVDVIVGPGNAWVTEAKRMVSGHVGIDMLAGPSELVVVADESSTPEVVAADLLAQAEHDPDARVVLLAASQSVIDAVRDAAESQLASLTTRDVARASWVHADFRVCPDDDVIVNACNALAPEHLHLNVDRDRAKRLAARTRHYGALFIGPASAEVFGDYGVGPNHVLPTGRTSRFRGGLSVLTFLRMRTWLEMADADEAIDDTRALAALEGLAAHESSAAVRRLA